MPQTYPPQEMPTFRPSLLDAHALGKRARIAIMGVADTGKRGKTGTLNPAPVRGFNTWPRDQGCAQ